MAANVTTPGAIEPKMWMGGIEPMKASYGKLMMWFFSHLRYVYFLRLAGGIWNSPVQFPIFCW